MNASMQRIAGDPPTYVLRLYAENDGDYRFLDHQIGLAVVQTRGDLAVILGLTVPDGYDRAARDAIEVALGAEGIRKVRAIRRVEGFVSERKVK